MAFGVDLPTLTQRIRLDTNDAEKGFGRLSGAASTFGKVAAVGFAALAAGAAAFGTKAVNAASDLNESLSKTNTVFGSSAEAVVAFSETSAQALGISKAAALEVTSTFGNLLVAQKLNADQAAELSMGLVTLASDLASFNNLEPELVHEKLRAAMTGEYDGMKQLGVAMNQTKVEAKAMEMGFAQVDGKFEESALIQARYAMIMEQTATAQGDFARTADGMANQLRILKANMADTAATAGAALLPLAGNVLGAVNTAVTAVAGPLSQIAGTMGTALVGIAEQIMPVITDLITSLAPTIDQLGGAFGRVFEALAPIAGALAEVFAAAAPLIPFFVEFIGLFAGSFAEAVVPVLGMAAEAFGGLIDTLQPVFESMYDVFDQLGGAVGEIFGSLVTALLPIITDLVPAFADVLLGIGQIFGTVLEAAGPFIGQLAEVFASLITAAAPAIEILGEIMGEVAGNLGGLLTIVLDAITPLLPAIAELGGMIGGALVDVFAALGPVIPPIADAFGRIVEAVMPLIPAVIDVAMALADALLPLLTPIAELFAEFAPVIADLAATLVEALMPVFVSLAGVLGEVWPLVAELVVQLVDELLPAVMPIIDVFAELLPIIAELAVTLIEAVLPIIETLAEFLAGDLAPIVIDLAVQLLEVLVPALSAIVPILDLIVPIIEWLAELLAGTLSIAVSAITGGLTLFGDVLSGLWTNVLQPVGSFIGGIFVETFEIFGTIAGEAFDNAQRAIANAWAFAEPIFNSIREWLADKLGPVFETFRNIASGAFEKIRDVVTNVWDNGISPPLRAFRDFIGEGGPLQTAFRKVKDVWTDIWNGIKDVASNVFGTILAAIDSGVEKVAKIIDGAIGLINKVSGFFGVEISPIDYKRKYFHGGGLVQGPEDEIPAMLRRGEFVVRREVVDKVGKEQLAALNDGLEGLDIADAKRAVARQPAEDPLEYHDAGITISAFGKSLSIPSPNDFVKWAREEAAKPLGALLDTIKVFAESAPGMKLPASLGATLVQGIIDFVAGTKTEAEKQLYEGFWEGVRWPNATYGAPEAGHVLAAENYVSHRWGIPKSSIGGYRSSGSVPGSDHPKGTALDIMMPSYFHPMGYDIAEFLTEQPDAFGTKYVIWADKIWKRNHGWSPYRHPAGNSPNLRHINHVHWSALAGRLGEGGLVTSPMFAQLGELGVPELVLPLDRAASVLAGPLETALNETGGSRTTMLTVAPGAVVVAVDGTAADPRIVEQVRAAVNEAFGELVDGLWGELERRS